MTFIPLPVDSISGAVQSIEYEHSRIHSGKGFLFNGKHTVANGASAYHLLDNPAASYPHLRVFAVTASSGPMDIEFYEGATTSASGTAVTPVNYNRNSATTAALACYNGPTVTTPGTLLAYMLITGTKHESGSGDSGGQTEWILKPSTKYLAKLTNNSGSSVTYALKLFWYEAS